MNAKKILFPVVAMLCLNSMWSQQVVDNICMQVIGSNGLSAEKLGRHYDATLGEVMTATLATTDGTVVVTQGFHQPECALTMVPATDLMADWQVGIYPNPTAATLHIQYTHPEGHTLDTRVWSITGALMADWQVMPSFSAIDCSGYTAGLYFLEIKDPVTGQITIIRFVKTSF
jgi:Secretion system C-terminal sorting domain